MDDNFRNSKKFVYTLIMELYTTNSEEFVGDTDISGNHILSMTGVV
jgi:hypothetical protein